jgi:hypothetical protein
MNYEKNIIRKKEWLFFIPFFVVSILSGKLVLLNSIKKSDLLNKVIIGLEWLFCCMLIVAFFYGIYKLIKKDYTLEKIWLFSGIFILLQFSGVYQVEILLKYYNLALNNIIFHDIMVSNVFSILYGIFLLYCVIKIKSSNTKNGLSKVNIIVLFLLLSFPFLRSINSYILRDILVEGLKNKRITIITRTIFTEEMSYSEWEHIAEEVMERVSLANIYIEFFYPKLIYGIVCIAGIVLFMEKITCQKYLALGGTFIIVQYLGIIYFDKILNCFNNSFYTSTTGMLYHILLNNFYPVFYITPLVLYALKKIYYHFSIPSKK